MRMRLQCLIIICGFSATIAAEEPAIISGGLNNPTGVAIQPDTGDVFVAERPGISRHTLGVGGKFEKTVEINDFPTDQYGKGPIYDIGPLGLAFASAEYLIVGDGSQKDVDELIRIYQLTGNPPSQPIKAASAILSLGPLMSTDELKAEGNYYGIAFGKSGNGVIYATANGDDTKGWILRSVLGDDSIPGELERFLATKEAVERDAPVAITMSPEGELVVGQMGEINVPGDSLLSIYDAESGELKANYETGLHDITGLAYDNDGNLYATDFAWMDTSKGALYKLSIDGDECTTTKVADLDKPTALAFDEDGQLYVTVFGTTKEGSDEMPGQLLRFSKDALTAAAKN